MYCKHDNLIIGIELSRLSILSMANGECHESVRRSRPVRLELGDPDTYA